MSVLEGKSNLDDLAKDELYGILMTYKMWIEPESVSRKESPFKETKESESSKSEWKNTTNISYEEEAKFMRKLKKRTM